MRTIPEYSSASSYDPRQSYVDHICCRHVWHEFATLTFKRPLTSFEQLERAKQMFQGWLHERYYDHAEQIGEVTKTLIPKYYSGLGGDGPDVRKVVAPKGYSGEWIRVPNTSTTQERRPNPELLTYPVGNQGEPVMTTRRWWDPERADYEGDDKGWRVDQVQDHHVRWSGDFHNHWRRQTNTRPIYILGVERHKTGAWHIHAVIHHRIYADTIRRDRGWQLWFSRYGRASITPVRNQADVAGYVSKYCVKDYATVDPRRQAEMFLSKYFGQQPRKVAGGSVATASAKHPAGEKLARAAMSTTDSSLGLLFPSAHGRPPSPVKYTRDLAPRPSSGGGVNTKLPRPKLENRGWSLMDRRAAAADGHLTAAAADPEKIRQLMTHKPVGTLKHEWPMTP